MVVPWLLPEFSKDLQVKNELKTAILDLSKDLDIFITEVEESEDPRYSPDSNAQLIVRLREADKKLQKARFLLVQRDALIDVAFRMSCDRLGRPLLEALSVSCV